MILYFLLMTYTYCMRSVLSVAIVAMNDNSTSDNSDVTTYSWDNQSVVLSAFFWGYVILQAARCSTGQEIRTKVASGSVVGNIVSLPVTGYICSSWAGWPVSFYLFGALGLKWVFLWMLLGADRPSCHKNITPHERLYIETSLGHEEHRVRRTPWRAILTSLPFWAVTFAFLGANWGSSVLLTQTPTYLNKILEYDIKSVNRSMAVYLRDHKDYQFGLQISLNKQPPVCSTVLANVVGTLSFGPICDMLINRDILSRGAARKIFNSIGSLCPALSLTLVGFIPKEKAGIAVTLLILNGGLTAGGFCGFQVNHMDLSPNHSGVLMGLSNGSTSIFSIISPLVVQYIVTDQIRKGCVTAGGVKSAFVLHYFCLPWMYSNCAVLTEDKRPALNEVRLCSVGPTFACRHVQAVLYFLLMIYTYSMRSVLSVAIVAMNDNSTSTNPNIPTYHWDNQSVVLSAFFWGYIVLQLPAAQLGKKISVKWLLVCCTVMNSIFCILIPTLAKYFGSVGVIVSRVFQGLFQGCIPPLVHNLLGHWAPPTERSVLGTFSYSGAIIGNILALSTAGVISSSWVGWPFSFYLFGGLGLKWVVLWIFLGADRPGTHKRISTNERIYIESSLAYVDARAPSTPWLPIFRSLPFWAITLAFVGANWGSSVLLTETPTYLDKVLEYDIKSNSLLSAAPYVAMWICSIVFSFICDMLINREILSRGICQKNIQQYRRDQNMYIGTILPAISLTMVGYIPKQHAVLSVMLLIFSGGISAGGLCGYQVNHLDLSPNHAGVLMALTNGISSIFSVISPLIVQYIVTDQIHLGIYPSQGLNHEGCEY
ncbi:hypothetical protein NQ318_005673 [Aromia moschata]|uniref:Putative inorganic phosphate cotransporter n=1 Tax=Aromia moschata TaxID=1265417 RepID=A0AAV8XFS7_9CUCU|nr:hypothetical protein NQ318_005673 [Aromia moschata]